MIEQSQIRNFCIIAHIDHGKSTLADRLLEYTGVVTERNKAEQILDSMELERERGITIKASAVAITYRAKDGKDYELNLIDTPGHVDFHYEVSRSLAACEGAIAGSGRGAGSGSADGGQHHPGQRAGTWQLNARDQQDRPAQRGSGTRAQGRDRGRPWPFPAKRPSPTSAKEGTGTEDDAGSHRGAHSRAHPKAIKEAPLQAMIFDSHFDPYRGIIAYVRIRNGVLRSGMRIQVMSTDKTFEVQEVGRFTLGMNPTGELVAGEVGYVAAGD